MKVFDPVKYLTRLAETITPVGDDGVYGQGVEERLFDAAHAFVALGVLDAGTVRAILAAHGEAASEGASAGGAWRASVSSPGRQLSEELRVCICGATVSLASGELVVRTVLLAPDDTTLLIEFRPAQRGRSEADAAVEGPRVPRVELRDEFGNQTTTLVNASSNGDEWRGRLTADTALAVDTGWLEVDRRRVLLEDCSPASMARVEPVAVDAERYVWHRMAAERSFFDATGGEYVAALVAAGRFPDASGVLDQVRTVRDRLWGSGVDQGSIDALPERWRSLCRERGTGGRVVSATLGGVTVDLDGVELRVLDVQSGSAGWFVEIDTVPSVPPATLLHRTGEVDGSMMAWWAVDNLGNWYLGQPWSGAYRVGSSAQIIAFEHPISSDAACVRLMPATLAAQAEIEVDLEPSRLSG